MRKSQFRNSKNLSPQNNSNGDNKNDASGRGDTNCAVLHPQLPKIVQVKIKRNNASGQIASNISNFKQNTKTVRFEPISTRLNLVGTISISVFTGMKMTITVPIRFSLSILSIVVLELLEDKH